MTCSTPAWRRSWPPALAELMPERTWNSAKEKKWRLDHIGSRRRTRFGAILLLKNTVRRGVRLAGKLVRSCPYLFCVLLGAGCSRYDAPLGLDPVDEHRDQGGADDKRPGPRMRRSSRSPPTGRPMKLNPSWKPIMIADTAGGRSCSKDVHTLSLFVRPRPSPMRLSSPCLVPGFPVAGGDIGVVHGWRRRRRLHTSQL